MAGCVSLLPKQTPAQLYRFEARAAPPLPTSDEAPRIMLVAPPVVLASAVSGDRMLAITGSEAALHRRRALGLAGRGAVGRDGA